MNKFGCRKICDTKIDSREVPYPSRSFSSFNDSNHLPYSSNIICPKFKRYMLNRVTTNSFVSKKYIHNSQRGKKTVLSKNRSVKQTNPQNHTIPATLTSQYSKKLLEDSSHSHIDRDGDDSLISNNHKNGNIPSCPKNINETLKDKSENLIQKYKSWQPLRHCSVNEESKDKSMKIEIKLLKRKVNEMDKGKTLFLEKNKKNLLRIVELNNEHRKTEMIIKSLTEENSKLNDIQNKNRLQIQNINFQLNNEKKNTLALRQKLEDGEYVKGKCEEHIKDIAALRESAKEKDKRIDYLLGLLRKKTHKMTPIHHGVNSSNVQTNTSDIDSLGPFDDENHSILSDASLLSASYLHPMYPPNASINSKTVPLNHSNHHDFAINSKTKNCYGTDVDIGSKYIRLLEEHHQLQKSYIVNQQNILQIDRHNLDDLTSLSDSQNRFGDNSFVVVNNRELYKKIANLERDKHALSVDLLDCKERLELMEFQIMESNEFNIIRPEIKEMDDIKRKGDSFIRNKPTKILYTEVGNLEQQNEIDVCGVQIDYHKLGEVDRDMEHKEATKVAKTQLIKKGENVLLPAPLEGIDRFKEAMKDEVDIFKEITTNTEVAHHKNYGQMLKYFDATCLILQLKDLIIYKERQLTNAQLQLDWMMVYTYAKDKLIQVLRNRRVSSGVNPLNRMQVVSKSPDKYSTMSRSKSLESYKTEVDSIKTGHTSLENIPSIFSKHLNHCQPQSSTNLPYFENVKSCHLKSLIYKSESDLTIQRSRSSNDKPTLDNYSRKGRHSDVEFKVQPSKALILHGNNILTEKLDLFFNSKNRAQFPVPTNNHALNNEITDHKMSKTIYKKIHTLSSSNIPSVHPNKNKPIKKGCEANLKYLSLTNLYEPKIPIEPRAIPSPNNKNEHRIWNLKSDIALNYIFGQSKNKSKKISEDENNTLSNTNRQSSCNNMFYKGLEKSFVTKESSWIKKLKRGKEMMATKDSSVDVIKFAAPKNLYITSIVGDTGISLGWSKPKSIYSKVIPFKLNQTLKCNYQNYISNPKLFRYIEGDEKSSTKLPDLIGYRISINAEDYIEVNGAEQKSYYISNISMKEPIHFGIQSSYTDGSLSNITYTLYRGTLLVPHKKMEAVKESGKYFMGTKMKEFHTKKNTGDLSKLHKYLALYTYKSSDDKNLIFKAGDIITAEVLMDDKVNYLIHTKYFDGKLPCYFFEKKFNE